MAELNDIIRIFCAVLLGLFIRLWWDERSKNRGK